MNFAFKPSPHIKRGRSVSDIMGVVTAAILFVLGWSAVSRFFIFGWQASLHIVLMVITTILGALFAQYGFYVFIDLLEKRKFKDFKERILSHTPKVLSNSPFVTALILAAALQPTTHLYLVFMVAVFAELFGKLVFGGFGQNMFNPVAVGLIFNALSFAGSPLNPAGWYPDAMVGATPIAQIFAANDWVPSAFQLRVFFNQWWSNLVFGNAYGATAETARLAVLIAFVYMAFNKVLDWVIPVFYFATIFVLAFIFGLTQPTDALLYAVMHLLVGGVIFGGVFMLTDPVTIPINRQGRVMFAILVASFTMLIRFSTSHNEGVAFSILLANILVPTLDRITSNVTTRDTHKKWISIAATFAIGAVVVLAFAIFV